MPKFFRLLLLLSFFLLTGNNLLLIRANAAEPAPILSLVKAPELKRDLKLSDEKHRQFLDLFKNLEELYQKIGQDIELVGSDIDLDSNLSRQEEEKLLLEIINEGKKLTLDFTENVEMEVKRIRKELPNVLTKEQYEKFSTRVIQVYAGRPLGYLYVELFDALKLTNAQKQELGLAYREYLSNSMDEPSNRDLRLTQAKVRERDKKIEENFSQILTQQQRDRRDELCLRLMPSYIRFILFPEELKQYQGLESAINTIPRGIRLAMDHRFLTDFRQEARLTQEESRGIREALQKSGVKFKAAFSDYTVNLASGMEDEEAMKTYIYDMARVYLDLNKELQTFLDRGKRSLLQTRVTQMAYRDMVMSCTFFCEDFNATSEIRKSAMVYEFKTTNLYEAHQKNMASQTPKGQTKLVQQYKKDNKECDTEFAATLTEEQRKFIDVLIPKGRPDYVTNVIDFDAFINRSMRP